MSKWSSAILSLTGRALPLSLSAMFLVVSCRDSSQGRPHMIHAGVSQTPLQSYAVDLSAKGKAAYITIDTTTIFCDEFIGLGGRTPEVVVAFRTLLKEKYADHAFKTLLKEATVAGQLYALCGLYYTDHDYFLQAIQPFRTSTQEVTVFIGCNVMPDSVCNIVEQDDRNTIRLDNEHKTIKEWVDKKKVESWYLDIVGGGWPNTFKESGGLR